MSRLLAVSPLADMAGGEVTLMRALPGLVERGWEARLTVPGRGPLAEAAAAQGIGTSTLPLGPPTRRSALAYAGGALALRHAAWTDVALLNALPAQRVVPALAALRRPAILRVNNPLPEAPRAWRRPWHWRVVRAVVVDTEYTRDECVEAGAPAERVHVLPPPAWAPAQRPAPREPGRDGTLTVGFVGRLEPRKGVAQLLAAAERFLATFPDARLVVVGEPPPGGEAEANRLRDAARRIDRVELRGQRPDAAREMAGYDLLVVPSLAEPFGTVAAEAAAAGVPVVASRVGGLPEVVLDFETGLLVPPGDSDALAAAVERLLRDPDERRRLGRRALELADRFAPERYVERLDALLRDALA